MYFQAFSEPFGGGVLQYFLFYCVQPITDLIEQHFLTNLNFVKNGILIRKKIDKILP